MIERNEKFAKIDYFIDGLAIEDGIKPYLFKVMLKLPDNVVQHIYEKCEFLMVSTSALISDFFTKFYAEKDLIIIYYNDNVENSIEDVIAHEIAHSFLKHGQRSESDMLDSNKYDEQEKEANDIRLF